MNDYNDISQRSSVKPSARDFTDNESQDEVNHVNGDNEGSDLLNISSGSKLRVKGSHRNGTPPKIKWL